MCLDVVETAQSVDVFHEVRRRTADGLEHALRAHMHMLGKKHSDGLSGTPVFQSRGTRSYKQMTQDPYNLFSSVMFDRQLTFCEDVLPLLIY